MYDHLNVKSRTCIWVTLMLTGVQKTTTTQIIDPGSAGILLVIQQHLSWIQPIRRIQLAALQQNESGACRWKNQDESEKTSINIYVIFVIPQHSLYIKFSSDHGAETNNNNDFKYKHCCEPLKPIEIILCGVLSVGFNALTYLSMFQSAR